MQVHLQILYEVFRCVLTVTSCGPEKLHNCKPEISIYNLFLLKYTEKYITFVLIHKFVHPLSLLIAYKLNGRLQPTLLPELITVHSYFKW
jgi:hypothetical protein